jgi:hypothetical protein
VLPQPGEVPGAERISAYPIRRIPVVLHQILMKLHARYALPQSIGTEWYDRGDEYEWGRILIGMAISCQVDGGYELHRSEEGHACRMHDICMRFKPLAFSELL